MKYSKLFKDKIVLEYISTPNYLKNIKILALKYNIGIKSISKWIKDSGNNIYNISQHTYINETVFDVIDTEEKAYWLGFIYADGCVYSKENRFELTLAKIDYNHLIKFALFMLCTDMSKIKFKTENECRILFRSTHLKESLIKLGCLPKKTLLLEFPDDSIFQSKDLIRHFMRGYVDGDGCIYIYKRNKFIYPCLNLIGTFNFLKGFIKHLPLSYNKNPFKLKNYTPPISSLHIWKESTKCLEFLYDSATIYLSRKYQKYLEILPFGRAI